MDLLEDFDRARSTLEELGAIGERFDSNLGSADDGAGALGSGDGAGGGAGGGFGGGFGGIGGGGGVSFADLPTLSVEVTARQAARGRGQIVAAACGSDTVLLATSRGFLLRYHWDDHGNERVVETELSKPQDASVRALFLDPGAHHALAVVRGGRTGAWETHYLHSTWTRARPLPKLQGLAVTAVGWQRQPRPVVAEGGEEEDLVNTTGDALIGTEAGSVHLFRFDQRTPKKEAAPATLLDWGDRKRAICGVAQEVLPCGARVVFIATPAALYITSGVGPSVETAFNTLPSPVSSWSPLIGDLEVPSLHSQLLLWGRPGGDPRALPPRFAWLVGSSICHGHLLLQHFADDPSVAAGEAQAYVHDMRQLKLGAVLGGGEGDGATLSPEDEPTSLAVTEFQFLLLQPERLTAINQISTKVVADMALTQAGSASGAPLQLLQSEGPSGAGPTLVCPDSLQEVALANEGRGMWRVFLENQDYDSALRLAVGPSQRDAVYLAMAQDSFAQGHYKAAASQYGRIVGGRPPFEDVALQLVEAGDPAALEAFLATKLQVLGRSDKAQSTLVATWLAELLLDGINRAALEAGGDTGDARLRAAVDKLRSFLSDNVESLDVGTTTGLLASYGRLDELQHFAAVRGDDEALLDHLMGRPEGALRALAVLRKPGVSSELVYKYAPPVVAQEPDAAVDFLVSRGSSLDPRRLLPALARFGEPGADAGGRAAALRYVRFAVESLRCTDGTVHNLAVALLSLDPDEAPLLDYLGRGGRNPLGRPLYDPVYALRLARDRDRPRACVKLLSQLGLHRDAVALALDQVDLQLAKAVAETGPPEDDEALRRKLWLEIARRVVQDGDSEEDQSRHIAEVMGLLREADGLLRIEDVLPLFPDFVTIDAFKAAIVDSLQRYSAQIEELKVEMDEATAIAEAVRSDLKALAGRAAAVPASQPCARCGRGLLEAPPNAGGLPAGGAVPPFYVYPTGLAFHVLCAAEEVVALGGTQRAKRTKQLLARLSRADPGAAAATAAAPEPPGTPPRQAPGGGAAATAAAAGGAEAGTPKAAAAVAAAGAAAGGGGKDATGAAAASGSKAGRRRDAAAAAAEEGAAAAAAGGSGGGDGWASAAAAVWAGQLEEEVGCEDPWNGDLVVRLVDAPFIDPRSDAAEVAAWQV